VYGGEEVESNFVNNTKKDVFLGASDVSDYIVSDILMERNERCLSTIHHEFTVIANRSEWYKLIETCGLRVIQHTDTRGMIVEDENLNYLSYEISSSSVSVSVHGDREFVDHWYERVVDQYEEVHNVIEWLYSNDGQSIEVPLRGDRVPVDEMYPWLNGEPLTEYYERFMHSDASILLLIGPPGTGKTTFIRGLLQHTKQSAVVTYDAAILAKDYLFAQFIEGDRSIMVIEDADNFLGNRSEGNGMMHKFLNVGDGLVTTKNKKMIFSTNLPSIKDIDPALIRPGRCFDIVNFAPLSESEATVLADKLGVVKEHKADGQYSIAEIFNKQTHADKAPRKRKMGFV
jgi:energy-coupling factor transporter ATP-binding protein EcfA2